MEDVTIYCYILGTPIKSARPIDLGEKMQVDGRDINLEAFTFGHLKKLRWPNNDKAHDLKLWKFETPMDVDNEELKTLNENFRANINNVQKLGEDLYPYIRFLRFFNLDISLSLDISTSSWSLPQLL
ncbi:13922_t:CDS:1, partial [Racocetra fulgida]